MFKPFPLQTQVLNPFVIGKGNVKATMTVIQSLIGTIASKGLESPFNLVDTGLDLVADGVNFVFGNSFTLELVAAELDPAGALKKTVKAKAKFVREDIKDLANFKEQTYVCEFNIPKDFGEIGAVLVQNDLQSEVFIKNIVIGDAITISCESVVHSKSDNSEKRAFFTSKVNPLA